MKDSGGEAEGPKNKSFNPMVSAETSRPKRSREKSERPRAKKSQEDRRQIYWSGPERPRAKTSQEDRREIYWSSPEQRNGESCSSLSRL